VDYKGAIDLVTEIDHQSEELVLGEIQRYSGHQIVSEEIGLVPGRAGDQWFVTRWMHSQLCPRHPLFLRLDRIRHEGTVTLAPSTTRCGTNCLRRNAERGEIERAQPAGLASDRAAAQPAGDGFSVRCLVEPAQQPGVLWRFAKLTRVSAGWARRRWTCAMWRRPRGWIWELSIKPWMCRRRIDRLRSRRDVTSIDGQADYINRRARCWQLRLKCMPDEGCVGRKNLNTKAPR